LAGAFLLLFKDSGKNHTEIFAPAKPPQDKKIKKKIRLDASKRQENYISRQPLAERVIFRQQTGMGMKLWPRMQGHAWGYRS
jgi:hypothetical protein